MFRTPKHLLFFAQFYFPGRSVYTSVYPALSYQHQPSYHLFSQPQLEMASDEGANAGKALEDRITKPGSTPSGTITIQSVSVRLSLT